MKAWQIDRLGGTLSLNDVAPPAVRPGSVRVRVEAAALLSYQKDYLEGRLPTYSAPEGTFTIGTGGIGTVESVGSEVWHLRPGQRVVLSPHFVAAENVEDPAQILIGLTADGAPAKQAQAAWRDGTFAELAVMPGQVATPLDGLEAWDASTLAVLGRFAVPFGGLRRGRLAAGETVVVTGATGAFGGAAVLLALAMGAARVVAAGRNATALEAVRQAGGARVESVRLTGDVGADTRALRDAAGGGAQLAFDMVGRANDANATLAALGALRRNGRLVLMGSMGTPLPLPYTDVMRANLEIIGNFMYPADALVALVALVRAGLLDPRAIRSKVFAMSDLPAALDVAASAGSLECVVLRP